MNARRLRNSLSMMTTGLVLMNTAWAGIPVWTFAPVSGYPSSVSVGSSETKTIKYTVTNQSHKPHTLQMKPIQGIMSSGCTSSLGYHQSCTLTLTVQGSGLKGDVLGGPILCEQSNPNQCYQPSQANSLAIRLAKTPGTVTLTPSVSTLGLSVSGIPRKITITNHGSVEATNVVVSSPGLPSDALVSPSSCGTIAANGGICEITVTPGATASSDASSALCTTGVQPEGSVSVTADGGLSTSVNTYVLSYGCIYQGGFIYSVNDATPDTGSIGGKVLALEDQKPRYPNGIVWDADHACTTNPYQCTQQTDAWDFYYGENLARVIGSTNPSNTGTNGPGNTYQIVSVLNDHNGNTNSPANYAAAVCAAYTGSNYTDWYLPAICEMGPASNGSGCSAGTPNIVDNLSLLLGDPNDSPDTSCSYGTNCLTGFYWSSTEHSSFSQDGAWYEYFAAGGGSAQNYDSKYVGFGVRCSRALTL